MSTSSNLPVISIMIPFIAAFIIGLIKEKNIQIKRVISIFASLLSFITTLLMIKPIFIENKILEYWMGGWEPIDGASIGIALRVDALSLFVGIIITGACLISSIYSIRYMEEDNGLSKYYMLSMLLTGSMIGFVFTGDLFNMYVMLEIMTIAAISLTAFRNHKGKALEASFKYVVIGGLGSSFILLGTVLLYMETHTLNILDISSKLSQNGGVYSKVSILAFVMLIVGYAVKAFMVPCHTWPPDAHMSAPSSISMLLSGVMSKTGVYGVIRILFLIFSFTTNNAIAYLIIAWGIITMILGVTMALLQSDFKRLLAFHSVSQIGYIIIGIGVALFANDWRGDIGLASSLFHMINHASFKCLLFLCAGAILYRTGTTNLDKVSGIGKKMPFTMGVFIVGALAISGIPPFNGFSSKWLIYYSTYNIRMPIVTIACLIVSVMTLASFIKVFYTVFMGTPSKSILKVKEVPFSMKVPMGLLAACCLLLGLFSDNIIKNFINKIIESIRGRAVFLDYISPYNPSSFLILFFILILAFIVLLNIKNTRVSIVHENIENSKFEPFVGGEVDYNSKLGSHDIFWGMKYEFKEYFNIIRDAHSGCVNDYALWVVLTLSFMLVYSFMFM
ncbi:proton-conducting transporter membrane subunit [Clostridium sardiniense]|uniref:proton-conducting transporter transmembrane domain-containing protein n=1 Tax=Clostridium sardiniense TaxID=29369 RepID=UPI00195D979D|nr:proton-conducting transporter membrane subunit [Clostridium sardiniense]MBM7833647.1 multicomponent Na+:H+ antiporter subunit D [Clostridium sardiniense]